MLEIESLLNKSYYDLMFTIDNYNKTYNRNIHIVVAKINNNLKFVKYIYSKDYYYVHLHTNDTIISNQLKDILKLPYENDRRHATYKYFLELINDIENSKKLYILDIFQKK